MPENVTVAGDIQAASLAQSIDWFGETFVITRQLASAYSTSTTATTRSLPTQSVKGIYDYRYSSPFISGQGSDTRTRERAIVIPTTKTNGSALDFTPGVGDTITANSLSDSIRSVDILQGSQGVTGFYRLTLEGG